MAKFVSALISVSDTARSRGFYEEVLGQTVKFDFGPNVAFEGAFAIHDRTHFAGLLDEGPAIDSPAPDEGAAERPAASGRWGELYFEDDDLEAAEKRLLAAGARFVHPIREQPWGQRVLRCLDPDGHVVEIGETMETTVRRMVRGGMTVSAAAARTGMPAAFIEGALASGNIA